MSVLLLAGAAVAQDAPTYPEGVPVTRMATPTEKAWMLANPLAGMSLPRNVTVGPPAGTVVGSGEYDPTEAIIMSWEGGTSLNNIQRVMIRNITTIGNADVYMLFDTTAERDSVMPTFATNSLSVGTVVSRVKSLVIPTDTIWLRDYGPRYVYEDGVRVISDHIYNVTSRTVDNASPVPFGAARRHAVYSLNLRHGGGNYHLNSIGQGYATALITNENTNFTQAQIRTLWQQHWGTTTNFTGALSTSVDGTQHIDMWMQIIGDNQVIISDFVAQSGTAQDNLVDSQAALMASQGWTVTRTPARNTSTNVGFNVHYTYTNVVMCNDLVLIPSYTNPLIVPLNDQALAAWQSAMPGKTIVQVEAEALARLSGVMHCIVMHMPRSKGEVIAGGIAPTARLRQPRGGELLTPGSTYAIRWITDDDLAVASTDIQLSTDGGQTFPVTLQNAGPDSWNFNWTVPDLPTGQARIRIVARDADGRTVSVTSPDNFRIVCPADVAGPSQASPPDGELTADDIIVFLGRFFSSDPRSDIAGPNQSVGSDTLFTADDIIVYLGRYFAGC
jgi:agmatine/peptidylarginine deiminase